MFNRLLHLLARQCPGANGFRPLLHRLRGVKVGRDVFIGDEVYLENEYPEAVELQNGVQISVRATIIAHTRGPGRIIIEKDATIGPNTVLVTSAGRVLRIGAGAVIGAGVVITNDVPAQIFVANDSATPVARALVPLTRARTMEEFIRGLMPLKRHPRPSDEEGQR
jgi:acetyltransferase-like isoleucine patch superfamily enzyme